MCITIVDAEPGTPTCPFARGRANSAYQKNWLDIEIQTFLTNNKPNFILFSIMNDLLIYNEKISSTKTEFLFLFLTCLFFLLLVWRIFIDSFDILAGIFLFLFFFFLFYSVNFRTLIIRLTSESLNLSFGIFSWTIPLDNIDDCRLDDISGVMKMGGAGIHFMFIKSRYRASFNFLEYPRVVVAFKRKAGLVQDISFSTRRPNDVIHHVQVASSSKNTT